MAESGEEAFARRMRMSGTSDIPPPPPPPEPEVPPPPASTSSATISRAPIRYNLPTAPAEIPASEAELAEALRNDSESNLPDDESAARSNRPGQKGFAKRLLEKYGWTKGSGLGADGTGITSALKVKVDKSKSGAHGKILGGHRKVEEGKFGAPSEVVILRGMLNGMDVEKELNEGGLLQEIGDECGEKVRVSHVCSWDTNLVIVWKG
jgi:splicing factor 45